MEEQNAWSIVDDADLHASTQSSIVTTFVYTDRELIRTTPITTVTTTITPAAVVRRDPDTPAARLVKDAFALFVRQTNGTAPGLNAMSAAFSSACACQTYTGAVVTETYTDEPTVCLSQRMSHHLTHILIDL